jgi:hypothetical protein
VIVFQNLAIFYFFSDNQIPVLKNKNLIFQQVFEMVVTGSIIFESSDAEQVSRDFCVVLLLRFDDQKLRSLLAG